jgi:hypothetical protein
MHQALKIEMPKIFHNIIEFKNLNNSMKFPFAIYADFECLLQKISTCQPSEESTYKKTSQNHVPTNFAYCIKNNNGDYKPPVQHFGTDAPKVFYRKLKEDVLDIASIYNEKVPMKPLTKQETKEFETQKDCYICTKPLHNLTPVLIKKLTIIKKAIQYYNSINDEEFVQQYTENLNMINSELRKNKRKVADHDHLTGQFQGAAHSICNLNHKVPKFIPIFFHDLSGYDAHLFIKEFGEDDGDIRLIPNTEEKYISFSKVLKCGIDNNGKTLTI